MGTCSSWSEPGCWAQRRAPWVFSHSSAQLTLAGTLRGKKWRRQEVRAFREGKIECQQQMVVSWALVPLPSVSPSVRVHPLPAGLLLWKSPISLLCPAPGSWTSSQSSLPLPRLCLLSIPPPLSPLPPRFLAFTSPGALDSPSPPLVQCPHQYSVLELLGLCLQLHAMLLEHSPLAQAPPDAVCRWVVGCSGAPLPQPPPHTQGPPRAGSERRRENQGETKKNRN